MFTREATKKEIAHYKKVEKLTANYTDEEYDNLLEIVSDFCYDLTDKVGTYTKIPLTPVLHRPKLPSFWQNTTGFTQSGRPTKKSVWKRLSARALPA